MARSSTSGPQLDDFIAKVVADPANPPNAVLMEGFIGASDADDHIRVYSDPSLASYVDVPSASILHSVKLPAEQSPLGGSMLWVDAGAVLRPQVATRQATAADFLQGPIQEQLGAAAVAGAAAAPVQITLLTHQGCPRPVTLATVCTQFGTGCPNTQQWRCPPNSLSTVCASLGITCTHFCPTRAPGCPNTSTCAPEELDVAQQQHLMGPTGWFGCTQPPHCFGPTGTQGCTSLAGCAQTSLMGCPRTSTCPPSHQLGCPDTMTCRPRATVLGCTPGTWSRDCGWGA
jgi:hypothetical protein